MIVRISSSVLSIGVQLLLGVHNKLLALVRQIELIPHGVWVVMRVVLLLHGILVNVISLVHHPEVLLRNLVAWGHHLHLSVRILHHGALAVRVLHHGTLAP